MSVNRVDITKRVHTVITYTCACPICKLITCIDEGEIEIGEAMCDECFKYFKVDKGNFTNERAK